MSKHSTNYLASGRILARQELPIWWEGAAVREGLDKATWRRDVITLEEVRKLIDFEPEQLDIYNSKGELIEGWAQVTRKDDSAQTFIVAPKSYTPHRYGRWIADVCEPLLVEGEKEGLVIASTGILDEGAYAWVSLSLPEAIKTKAGLDILPSLFTRSSMNQSLKTGASNVSIHGICDNTVTAAERSGGLIAEVKHTSGSTVRWAGYAGAVAQFLGFTEKAKLFVDGLADIPMTDADFETFLGNLFKDAEGATDQAKTMNANKRDVVRSLHRNDVRCAPWAGSALGAFQAANTWSEHYKTVRMTKNVPGRDYRNQLNRITGTNDDDAIIAALEASISATPTSLLVTADLA